jgi:hypothetical protein
MGIVNSMTAKEYATLYRPKISAKRKQLNHLPIILLAG